MKTHEFSKYLLQLARVLKNMPDVELSDLNLSNQTSIKPASKPNKSDIPIALATLAGLSRFSKAEWKEVITEYKLNVEVKQTDSTRDLLGRLLKYLNSNPDAIEKLSKHRSSKVSSELQEALSILLK